MLVFFDDILIYNKSWADHMEHLRVVLKRLGENHWVANKKKCEFGCVQIGYLGHLISEKGVVEMDPGKIKVVLEWERPQNIKALRGFLGLTGYYRRFVKDYGKISKPLTKLLKKGEYGWNEKAEEAMSRLKVAITSAPVLILQGWKHQPCSRCAVQKNGGIVGRRKGIVDGG